MDAKLPVRSILPPGYFPLEANLRLNRDIEFQSNASQTTRSMWNELVNDKWLFLEPVHSILVFPILHSTDFWCPSTVFVTNPWIQLYMSQHTLNSGKYESWRHFLQFETFFREKPSRKPISDSIGANLKITFCKYLESKYYDQQVMVYIS